MLIIISIFTFLIGAIILIVCGAFANNNTTQSPLRDDASRQSSETVHKYVSKQKFNHPNYKLTTSDTEAAKYLEISTDGTAVVSFSLVKGKLSDSVAEVILSLLVICPVVIVTQVLNDKEQNEMLHSINSILDDSIPNHRLLFCQSTIGKVAILRQLKPALHVEWEASVMSQISPHMRVAFIHDPNHPSKLPDDSHPWRMLNNISDLLPASENLKHQVCADE